MTAKKTKKIKKRKEGVVQWRDGKTDSKIRQTKTRKVGVVERWKD